MMQPSRRQNPNVILTSDASGSWGCGAYYNSLCLWLQYPWSSLTIDYHITAKELLPIVFAAAIWAKEWANKSVLCRCDNQAVVHTGTNRDPIAMGLMRCLYFIAAKFNLLISAVHLAGTANGLADALSRNNLPAFISNYPQASPRATPVPEALVNLLVGTKPDWTSPHWSSTFNSIFNQPCPKAHRTYSAHRRYVDFCSRSGHQLFPASESVLCQYVSFLGHEKLKHKTIKSYLSSVRFFQILHSSTDPFIRDMPKLQYVLRGIKSEEAKKGQQSRPRLPITPSLLTRVHHILLQDPTNVDHIMLWAASLLCFFWIPTLG